MEVHASDFTKVDGKEGDRHIHVEVPDNDWYKFNHEYYKLREMDYYAMYKIPEFVLLRKHMHAVRGTKEFATFEAHWEATTQNEQHQVVVEHQGTLLLEAVKTIHMTDADEKWVDPHYSPVMFEVWHLVYLYFNAVGKGDLTPMLDFFIDGKYDQEFTDRINPKFGRPDENLYLF